jgi:hypothetical protein
MGRQLIAMGMGMGIMTGGVAPVWPAGGGPGGDADDPWGGAGPLHHGLPCPGRHVTRDATAGHGGVFWVRVAAT